MIRDGNPKTKDESWHLEEIKINIVAFMHTSEAMKY
jgi:hypothetical protein